MVGKYLDIQICSLKTAKGISSNFSSAALLWLNLKNKCFIRFFIIFFLYFYCFRTGIPLVEKDQLICGKVLATDFKGFCNIIFDGSVNEDNSLIEEYSICD